LFGDEASLSNTATVGYQWNIRGHQGQVAQVQRKKERRTLFGGVEPATGRVIYHDAVSGNTKTFFSFLLKTVKAYPNKKVVMVVDNVRFHHAKRLKPLLERYNHRIELCFLPAYSPDLNPIERIWWYMRKSITHNRFVESIEQRMEKFSLFIKQFEQENQLGKNLCNLTVNIY
jgi:transposase